MFGLSPRMLMMIIFGIGFVLFTALALLLLLKKGTKKSKATANDFEDDDDGFSSGGVAVDPDDMPIGSPFAVNTPPPFANNDVIPEVNTMETNAFAPPPMAVPPPQNEGVFGVAATPPPMPPAVSNNSDVAIELVGRLFSGLTSGQIEALPTNEHPELHNMHSQIISNYASQNIKRTTELISVEGIEQVDAQGAATTFKATVLLKDYIQDASTMEIIGGEVDKLYKVEYYITVEPAGLTGIRLVA